MHRWLAAVLALGVAGAAPPTLTTRIEAAIRHHAKALAPAIVGIQVIDLRTGALVFQQNADHLFIPASNMKLFTTALALRKLGPNYRFLTTVSATQAPDALGRVDGDIVWTGSGDPTLSGRPYPYINNSDQVSLGPVNDLADQIVAAGVREVSGDIVGDDTRYPYEPHPGSWSIGDEQEDYGAPVSALIVNDNRFLVQVIPAADGELAEVITTGMPLGMVLDNRVRTVAQGVSSVQMERTRLGTVRLSGTVPGRISGITEALAVDDPAQFAAALLRDALIQRGVNVHGDAVARHRAAGEALAAPGGPVVARRTSPPMSDILQVEAKVSQNLHAEVLLREVGVVRRGRGTREAGLLELSEMLKEWGINQEDFILHDGSGLSRTTLVTPAAIVKLLAAMYESGQRDLWMNLLPVGGVDGTLDHRFTRHPEARRIQAKTGSLSHVRAMSGYAQAKDGTTLVFSILVNNFGEDATAVAKFLDEVGLTLLQ